MYDSSTFPDGHVLLLYSFFPVLWIQGLKASSLFEKWERVEQSREDCKSRWRGRMVGNFSGSYVAEDTSLWKATFDNHNLVWICY